ncbi:MAG: ankyrin repeat domain-containing protein [Alphaproteobacteria bacterium]|nr:ankyrin repeat domain-containing protein [Alphaproteobacteria bacterium]
MQTDAGKILIEALVTGDYTEVKKMIKAFETGGVFLDEAEKTLQVINYFIDLNIKMDVTRLSKKQETDLCLAIYDSDLEKIQKLMNQYDKKDIFEHVIKNDLKKVQVFIGKTGKVNLKNKQGKTLLEIAASSGSVEVADFLIQKGAKLKNNGFFDWNKVYPLLFAIREKQEKMVKFLLEKGACLFKENNHSHPATFASNYANAEILSLILNEFQKRHQGDSKKEKAFWAKNYALHNAVSSGEVKMVKVLLEAKAPLYSDGTFVGYQMRGIKASNKEMLDLLFAYSNQKEQAMLFENAVFENNTEWMYHLYHKKCPVMPKHVAYLEKENIVTHAIYHKNLKQLDKILKEMSDTEKKALDWEKIYEVAQKNSPFDIKLIEKYDPNKKHIVAAQKIDMPKNEPTQTVSSGTLLFDQQNSYSVADGVLSEYFKVCAHKKNQKEPKSNEERQKD